MSDGVRESGDNVPGEDSIDDAGDTVEPAPAAAPTPWYRRRWPWLVSAAAVLVGLVVAGTLVLVDTHDGPAVGTLLPAARSEIEGTEVLFELPTGGVTFTVADPVEEVAEDSRIPTEREAGGDTSLLGVQWRVNLGGRATHLGEIPTDELIVASATLIVDGEHIALGELWDLGVRPPPSTGFLVVPGAADQLSVDDLVLEVSYDGLVQSVNVGTGEGDRGVAGQYDSGTLPSASAIDACPERADVEEEPGLVTTGSCSLENLVLTPYLQSLGWAEPASTWALVHVSVYVYTDYQFGPGDQDGSLRYELTSATQEATLDGEPRAAELGIRVEYEFVVSTMAFQVPSDQPPTELVISGVYQGVADNPGRYPASAGFPATVSVPFDVVLTLPEVR